MTTQTIDVPLSSPLLIRLWSKIPAIIRAVALGFLIFTVLQLAMGFVVLNAQHWPEAPWSAPVIIGVFYLAWRYLAGQGWPTATKDSRRKNMRVGQQSRMRFLWGWVTAIFILGHMIGIAVITTSLIQFPEGSSRAAPYLSGSPALTALVLAMAFAFVAGFSEEVGFRGYMLVPLEEHYGVTVAVVIVALVFWLAHYQHATFLHSAPFVIGGGIFMGFLASFSKSIGPSIAVHTAVNTFGIATVDGMYGVPQLYTMGTVWETGLTQVFLQAVAFTAATGVISALMLIRMAKMKD